MHFPDVKYLWVLFKSNYYRVRTVITKWNSRIFQYIPGWIELNFHDFSDSDVVYWSHNPYVAINMLSSGRKLCEGHDRRRTIYFGLFCGDEAFSSMFLIKLIC